MSESDSSRDHTADLDPTIQHEIRITALIPHDQVVRLNRMGEWDVQEENDVRDRQGHWVDRQAYRCTCGFFTHDSEEAKEHVREMALKRASLELLEETQEVAVDE